MADLGVAGPGASVRFGILGPLQVVDAARVIRPVRAAKQRVVLAALLLGGGTLVSTQRMSEALWDVSPPPNAPSVMRTYVARLRRDLGPLGARVIRLPGGWAIRLNPPDELDLAEVEQLRTAARAAGEAGDWHQVSTLLAVALSLWRGEPLIDVPSAVLTRRDADRLGELRLQLTLARIDADLRLGRHTELIPELRRLVAEHPLQEHVRVQLMLACYRSGNQAAALDAYRDAHRTLSEELGVAPGPELRETHHRILADELDLVAQHAPEAELLAKPLSPDPVGYRHGLPLDTAAFTGREAELDLITNGQEYDPLIDRRIIIQAISGMPGAGKTALAVHAAHKLAAIFPDRQVFLNLHGHTPDRDPLSPGEALAELLTATGTDTRFLPPDVAGRSAIWRDKIAGQRALLVLDNAASTEQVAPLLPGSPGCLVLVTSRRQLADLPDAIAPVVLGTLPPQQARTMFLRLTPRAATEDRAVLDELTALAGHLPLAISVLSRVYGRHPSWTLADLIVETQEGLPTMAAEHASIATVLEVSWKHLNSGSRKMLAMLGLHPGTSMEKHAAAALAGVPVAEAVERLDDLHRECLLTETGHRRYAMHVLTRWYAVTQARTMLTDKETTRAVDRLISYYVHASASQPSGWARAERANLRACLRYAKAAGRHSEVVALTTALAGLLPRDRIERLPRRPPPLPRKLAAITLPIGWCLAAVGSRKASAQRPQEGRRRRAWAL